MRQELTLEQIGDARVDCCCGVIGPIEILRILTASALIRGI